MSSSSSFIGKFMNAELVGAKTVQGPASNKTVILPLYLVPGGRDILQLYS